MMPRPKSSNLIEVLNKQALIGKSSDWNLSKYFLPHSSTVKFSLSLKSGRNENASHSHSFWRIMLIFSPVVGLIPCDTLCEFQSDRPTLDFWPKSCRTARRLDTGQISWVLGRLGCVLDILGWVLGWLGWFLGPLGWVQSGVICSTTYC